MSSTLRHTGDALTGSALTTLDAFVMLSFAGLVLIQQLGVLGGTAVTFALLTALFVEPGALYLWARPHQDARARPRLGHLGGGTRPTPRERRRCREA